MHLMLWRSNFFAVRLQEEEINRLRSNSD